MIHGQTFDVDEDSLTMYEETNGCDSDNDIGSNNDLSSDNNVEIEGDECLTSEQ